MNRSALTLSLVLLAGVAHADKAALMPGPSGKQRIVGLLDVRGPTPHDEAAFEKNLEEQLDTDQYWLAPRAKMRERLRNSTKWTEGCLVHRCLAEVKVQTNAELVILAALTGSGTSFGFVVTLVRTDTGRVVSQEAERCDVCTLSETMSAATLATIKLLNELPDRLPDESAQQGAAVEVAVDSAIARAQRKLAAEQRGHTRTGVVLTVVGLVAVAAGTAAYLLQDERPDYGLVAATAGGGLALGGIVVLAF